MGVRRGREPLPRPRRFTLPTPLPPVPIHQPPGGPSRWLVGFRPMSGDVDFRVADRADEPARVLRRVFVVAVVLVFLVGLPLGTVTTVIGVVIAALALAVELLLPRERRLGHWQVLVAGQARRSDSAYGAVFQALREREVPGEVRPQRVRTATGLTNGLTIRLGAHRVQVSVHEFGTGLVLGWTVWHRQLPALAVLHWVATGVGAEPVRDEPVRALVDAVDAAVRQGAEAARAEDDVPLAEAFGYDVPVEDRTTPAPPPPPAPSQPPVGPPPGAPLGGPQGPPTGGTLVPGMVDEEERTALIAPQRFSPFEFSVGLPVEVYTPEGAVVGRLEPGTRYWAVDEHPSGLVVQIAAGAALLRDRSTLRRD
jgi:hypothetical protein